jgi:GrpB-like predicted nucleotidyltransferase (UPF0157 family)
VTEHNVKGFIGMPRIVEIAPHNTEWKKEFLEEAENLKLIFGEELVAIHHKGSTAIPGIYAKPIIDLMPVVRDIDKVDALNDQMIKLGYHPKGEYGLPGRRYFFKGSKEFHTHHMHVYQVGHPDIERHLLFIEYLKAHPQDAQAYSRLKEKLAKRYRDEPEKYTDAKTDFILGINRKARVWKESLQVESEKSK